MSQNSGYFTVCGVHTKIEWTANEFLLIDSGVTVAIHNYYSSTLLTARRYKTFENVFETNFKNVNLETFIIKIDSMIRSYKKNNEKVLRNSKAFVDHKPALQRNPL